MAMADGHGQSATTATAGERRRRRSTLASPEKEMQRRYHSLQLHDAISRRHDYVEACKELQSVLRAVYVSAPKPLQALIYDDILHAFRTLPRTETSQQLAAAKLLLQTAEDVFPKQRRLAAAHEYKIAIIAWHRQYKNPEPLPECLQLSGDMLLHVFEYLDARSLATASAVCRAWNVVASDNTLWRTQFLSLFRTSSLNTNLLSEAGVCEGDGGLDQGGLTGDGIWRKAFDLARKGRSPQLFTSNRAYCPVCKEVIWLTEPPWKPAKGKCVARKKVLAHHAPRPMSLSQVVRYVVSMDTASASESSSSESDEEDADAAGHRFFRLWSVPKRTEV